MGRAIMQKRQFTLLGVRNWPRESLVNCRFSFDFCHMDSDTKHHKPSVVDRCSRTRTWMTLFDDEIIRIYEKSSKSTGFT